VVDINKGVLSFGSMTLLVGGLALAGLLFWGWQSGEELPLWPALLVAAVNVFGAFRLVKETRARQAARQAAAVEAAQPHRKGKG
jgi:fatty acid desaturase